MRWNYSRAKWLIIPLAIVAVIAINPPTWVEATISDRGWIKDITYSESAISNPVTQVLYGGTVEVLGTPIRLSKLDCAEWDTAAGRTATARMQELAKSGTFTCQLHGRRSYDRKIGECEVNGRDVSDTMIAEGYCRRWR